MEISTLQENLKKGLSIVSKIAGKNINLPILNNVMIEANDGNIRLIATDLEIGVICNIRGQVKKDGVFTVDSKMFFDYISLLSNKKIDLKVEENKIFIESENYKTVLKGCGAEDFPLIPKINKEEFYEIDVNIFKKALAQVIFAVSNTEARIELSGVLFDIDNGILTLAATDSYRLAEKKIEIKIEKEKKFSSIIPAKTIQELLRILSVVGDDSVGDEKNIKVFISNNQILFNVGGTELISRLVEGQYPDYKQIIPVKNETTVVVDKAEFVRAIKTSSIFSKIGINDVNLDFPIGKKIVISSTSSQSGENVVELDAEMNGADNGIVVNYRYLLDGVNNINGEEIIIEVTNNNTPCVLKSKNNQDYLYIVMPIKQ